MLTGLIGVTVCRHKTKKPFSIFNSPLCEIWT